MSIPVFPFLRCLAFSLLLLPGGTSVAAGAPALAVSIPPLRPLAEALAGPEIRVTVILPHGESPANYQPSPRAIAAWSGARLLYRVGVPFEDALMRRIADFAPGTEVVDLREGMPLRTFADNVGDGMTAANGWADRITIIDGRPAVRHGDHYHYVDAPDPHLWMDPVAMRLMTARMAATMSAAWPEYDELFAARAAELTAALDELHTAVERQLRPYAGRAFFVFHPAYGYFAARYDLRQIALEADGKVPSARQLADFVDQAQALGVDRVFVQPQFDQSYARRLADAIGGTVVVADPLRTDYLDFVRAFTQQLIASWEPLPASPEPVP